MFSRTAVNFRFEFKIAIQHTMLKWAKKPECTDVKKEAKIKRYIKDIKSFITH